MKTKAISLVALMALVLATSAFAATNTYRGDIKNDPEASVQLKIKEEKRELTVTLFTAKNFLIKCKNDPDDYRLGRASLTGAAPVSAKGKFRIKGENDTQKLTLRGKVNGDKAKGRFSFSGLTSIGNRETECESGALRWTAKT